MRTKRALLLVAMLLLIPACSSDDGQEGAGSDAVITVFVASPLQRAIPDVVEAYKEQHPGVEVEVTIENSGELSERLSAGEVPDLYIDRAGRVDERALEDPSRPTGEVGSDVMGIVVPRGNPAGVTDLSVFGDSPVRTALCVATTPCGVAALAVLESAGVTPAPDLVGDGWLQVADATANGEVDASLLNRTEFITKIQRIEVVPLPADQERRVTYKVVALSGKPEAAAFVEWLVGSDEANAVLRTRGLRDFFAAAPEGGEAAETGASQ